MNSRGINHLRVQGFHSGKKYSFLFSRPTAEVITIIPEIVDQALNKNHLAGTAASDILKRVDNHFSTGVSDDGFFHYDSL